MKYNKINPEETEVIENGTVIGSIKREIPPIGIPIPWVYRFWPKGATSITQATSAFETAQLLRSKLENRV